MNPKITLQYYSVAFTSRVQIGVAQGLGAGGRYATERVRLLPSAVETERNQSTDTYPTH